MLRRMSDLALTFPGGPHSLVSFDSSRYLTGADVLFAKQYVKLVIKWSKTIQTKDLVQILTLHRLLDKKLCPRSALKALQSLYLFDKHSLCFNGKGGFLSQTLGSGKPLGLNPSHFIVFADQLLHWLSIPMCQFKV